MITRFIFIIIPSLEESDLDIGSFLISSGVWLVFSSRVVLLEEFLSFVDSDDVDRVAISSFLDSLDLVVPSRIPSGVGLYKGTLSDWKRLFDAFSSFELDELSCLQRKFVYFFAGPVIFNYPKYKHPRKLFKRIYLRSEDVWGRATHPGSEECFATNALVASIAPANSVINEHINYRLHFKTNCY